MDGLLNETRAGNGGKQNQLEPALALRNCIWVNCILVHYHFILIVELGALEVWCY